jgi:hypothetical protein
MHDSGAPAQGAGVTSTDGVLYSQLDQVGSIYVSSQDFTSNYNAYDSIGADDFVISSVDGVKSWEIDALTVDGAHLPPDATATDLVNVRFYSDLGLARPASQLFTRTATISPTTLVSGDFYLPLNQPVILGAGGHYWVSLQAVKPATNPSAQWMWVVRSVQANHAAVWQNPGGGFQTGCTVWTPITTCFSTLTSADLLFSLIGDVSSVTNSTPVLTDLSPDGGYDEDIPLLVTGANFASGAVISWTVNSEAAALIPGNLVSGSYLTATVAAQHVDQKDNTAQVVVVNPGPCAESCVSNALTFTIDTLEVVYIPIIKR